VLDREKYRFQKYISDISGQDIKAHDGKPALAIKRVRDWLNNSPVDPNVTKPGARKMAQRYDRFMGELPDLCEELHLHHEDLTFNDFTTISSRVAHIQRMVRISLSERAPHSAVAVEP